MPSARITMRKIREVMRLKFDLKFSNSEIGKSCKMSSSTVSDYLRRLRSNGLEWPIADSLSNEELETALFRSESYAGISRPKPDWNLVHKELRRQDYHVTLMTLWDEYRKDNEGAEIYEYSWFCHNYAAWNKHIDPVMRQRHVFGEKVYVDYAGDTVPIVDPRTGEVRAAQIFVAAAGGSSYAFAEATWSQQLPCWITSHVRMLEFYGGCFQIVVPDNLRSGVSKADFYEPDINPTYHAMAKHYGIAVLPARKAEPTDKAKVESTVLVVERWILARLRNRTFYGLDQLNTAIAELLDELNEKPFQKLPGSRREMFELHEFPALRPLPTVPYEYADCKRPRVHLDYHVQLFDHYYSVPYELIGKVVDARVTSTIVEIMNGGIRVASHKRSYHKGAATTLAEHMPAHHQAVASWTPERMRSWAAKVGVWTEGFVCELMTRKEHPEQGVRAALGALSLAKKFSRERLDLACQRATYYGAFSVRALRNILKNNLEQGPLEPPKSKSLGEHENVRGAGYYGTESEHESEQLDLFPSEVQDRQVA